MSRDFNKVAPALWRSARFRSLSEPAKIGFLYLITSGHVTSAGVYVLPDGYACSDLGWEPDAYKAVCDELVAAEMIDRDTTWDVILIERWFKHNALTGADYATGCRRRIEEIDSGRLREKALAAFEVADAERLEAEAKKEAAKAERIARRQFNGSRGGTQPIGGITDRLLGSKFMSGKSDPDADIYRNVK